MCVSLADTYADGAGGLDLERSQLGAGMSQRGKVKRFVTALQTHAQRCSQTLYDLQQLRSLARDLHIEVMRSHAVLLTHTQCCSLTLTRTQTPSHTLANLQAHASASQKDARSLPHGH